VRNRWAGRPARPLAALLLVSLLVGALAGCRDDRNGAGPTADAAAAVGVALARVGPTGGRCSGVTITTENEPHRVMRAHPAGTTFCLDPGVHRIRWPLRPQEGDTIAGRPGAVLSGAVVLNSWRPSTHGWTALGVLPSEPSTHGPCLRSTPDCTYAEDAFLDGRPLTRVASEDEVTAGTFFADYDTGTVTIGSDPTGALVEQAVAPGLVRSGRDGVTVRDLVLEMAANEAQVAAVDSRRVFPRAGVRWRVIHNDVRLNHGVGVGTAGGGRVRGNVIREQGQLGLSVWGRNARVRRNEISYNGRAGYDPDWEAGGVKSWMTSAELLEDNHVHHNLGPGLWSDGGCDRTVYRANVIADNWGPGIQHEISYDALIVGNRIERNGLRRKGWVWGAGIQIQSSGGRGLIDVRRNVVVDNTHGIAVIDSSDRRHEVPHPEGPHVVRNVRIRHNDVTMHSGQWTGLFHDYGNHAVFSRGIRFVANTYRLDSAGQRAFGWEDEMLTWDLWRAQDGGDQDRAGKLLTGPP
jgi:hypothetical protein